MSRTLILKASVLAGALVVGCTDQPTLSEPRTTVPPSFRTEQNPEGPGAFAIHVPEASFITGEFEPEPGITVHVGITYAEHLQWCETREPPFPMDRLLVFRPDGSVHTRVQGAQVPVVVWQAAPTFTGDIFADVCTEEFLALPHLEGTAQFLDRDNDADGSGDAGNPFGTRIVGQVSSESGDRFQIFVRSHFLILPKSDEQIVRQTVDFDLKSIGQ